MENGLKIDYLANALEALTDKYGILDVAIALELLCDDKAIHIQHVWQDKPLADVWARMGDKFANVASIAQKANI